MTFFAIHLSAPEISTLPKMSVLSPCPLSPHCIFMLFLLLPKTSSCSSFIQILFIPLTLALDTRFYQKFFLPPWCAEYKYMKIILELYTTACNMGDLGSIPGSGRSPGEGNSYPLQCFGLENSMHRGAWQAIVHGVTKSRKQLNNFHLYKFNEFLYWNI